MTASSVEMLWTSVGPSMELQTLCVGNSESSVGDELAGSRSLETCNTRAGSTDTAEVVAVDVSVTVLGVSVVADDTESRLVRWLY